MKKNVDDIFGGYYNLELIDEEEEYEKKHKHKKNKKKDKKKKKSIKSSNRPIINLPPVTFSFNIDLGAETENLVSAIGTIGSKLIKAKSKLTNITSNKK